MWVCLVKAAAVWAPHRLPASGHVLPGSVLDAGQPSLTAGFFPKFHSQTPSSLCGLTALLLLGIPRPSCFLFDLVSTGPKGKWHLRAGTTVAERRPRNWELGRDSYMEIPISVLQGPPGSGSLTGIYCL